MAPRNIPTQKIFCLLALLVIPAIYWPGLAGGLMLDDFSALPSLFTTIENCGFWCGVMSGSTGPTGRPISLFSFALQQTHWPDAYYFKFVNISIHLINSFLVFLIFFQVLKNKYSLRKSGYIAILATVLWAIWPLQISSVLYVVQRMVLLSSLFVLTGLYVYVRFRENFSDEWKSDLGKWATYLFAIGLCGLLAIFSKESGVLLVVYIAALELILYSGSQSFSRYEKWFRYVALPVPLLGLIGFLFYKVLSQGELLYLAREFTLQERLLTECRILLDYLGSLFLPKVSSLGLYHDAYPKSTSIFEPISTLFSLLFLVISAILGLAYRKKLPLISLAILWFLGGHLLESTVLPLELYFEHRNYLPIMMLTLAFVTVVFSLIQKASRPLVKWIFSSVFVIYGVIISGVTYSQVVVWGNKLNYGVVQAIEHPESVRARTLLIDVYNELGQVDKGFEEFQKMQEDFPQVAGIIVGHIEFACYDPKYPLLPIEEVVQKLEKAKFGYGVIVSVATTISEISEQKCQKVQPDYLLNIIHALKNNPLYSKKKTLLEGYEVSLLTLMGDYERAVDVYASMNVLQPEHWPRYISLLATLKRFDEALKVAEKAIEVLDYQSHYSIYLDDVKRFKENLKEDIEKNLPKNHNKI